MRLKYLTAAAVLITIAAAEAASAQCVSAVHQIASRSSLTSIVAGPAAWSGSIIAVASNQARNGAVWVTLFNQFGDALYPGTKFPSSDDADILDILWNGEHFGVFYRNADDQLILRRVNTSGELLGNAVNVGKLTIADDEEVDIFFSSRLDSYVIARAEDLPTRGIWLTYVKPDGAVTRNVQIADGTPAPDSLVRVAETQSAIIGVWYEADGTRNIIQARIEEGAKTFYRKVWTPGDDLVVTAHDNRFVLARTFEQPDTRKIIRWKIVDTTGMDVREEGRLLIGTGKDVRPLALLSRGDELAITYLDSRDGFATQTPSYRLRRFDPDSGEAISDTYFAAADRTRHRAFSEHDFVWTGSAYVAITVRETDDGDDSFLMRQCPLQAVISAPRQVAPGTTVTFVGSADGGVPLYQYRWTWGVLDSSTGPTLQQRYDTPGNYTVRLTVTDDTDTVATQTFTITVAEPEPQPTPKRRAVRK